MHQPPSFHDRSFLDYVYLLQKSLYGLKQTPRAWYHRFAYFFIGFGFTNNKFVSSLFIYRQSARISYLLLYVDDIVLSASSSNLLQLVITNLHSEFSMTNLGTLNYFLGIAVIRDSHACSYLSRSMPLRFLIMLRHLIANLLAL